MALDELHARRLATVVSVVEGALDRMELVLRSLENRRGVDSSHLTEGQIRQARDKMESLRHRVNEALERFAVRLHKPEPKQVLAAELSTLWVVLENARPERMKGYGRKFTPADRAAWENLIQELLHDLEQVRCVVLAERTRSPNAIRPEAPEGNQP
jgi:hypothetical protein